MTFLLMTTKRAQKGDVAQDPNMTCLTFSLLTCAFGEQELLLLPPTRFNINLSDKKNGVYNSVLFNTKF